MYRITVQYADGTVKMFNAPIVNHEYWDTIGATILHVTR